MTENQVVHSTMADALKAVQLAEDLLRVVWLSGAAHWRTERLAAVRMALQDAREKLVAELAIKQGHAPSSDE